MASVILNGYREEGRDNTIQIFNTIADLTPSGASGLAVGAAGILLHNFSGTASTVYTIPSGTLSFKVVDLFGKAASSNIIVSGSSTAMTFNGAATSTLSTNFGTVRGTVYSGSTNFIVG